MLYVIAINFFPRNTCIAVYYFMAIVYNYMNLPYLVAISLEP